LRDLVGKNAQKAFMSANVVIIKDAQEQRLDIFLPGYTIIVFCARYYLK
jgi:hypothetical protein